MSLVIAPGSRQVLSMLSQNGALHDMIEAGARICETACGFCIGMGQSPKTNGVSVRTNNRNFFGRSGTKSAGIYLTSCETAAVTALTGVLTDPRETDADLTVEMPEHFAVHDNMILPPASPEEAASVEVVRGPNIQPFPKADALADSLSGPVLLKMEDNITTDHIMPSGSDLLPFRAGQPMLISSERNLPSSVIFWAASPMTTGSLPNSWQAVLVSSGCTCKSWVYTRFPGLAHR